MIKQRLKKFLNTIFNGSVLPVFSSQLRGMRLKVDPLMPSRFFWNNVEVEVHNVYDICIKKGFVVLDIGANVGLHSYYISRRFENTRVYAFEPFPGNANYIREMISINKIRNITLLENAVGFSSGNCNFDMSINNHQGRVSDEKAGLIVSMVSLDDFLSKHNLQPDLIKIDVEGGESAVLNGFQKSIALLYPIIIVELHNVEQTLKVADFFRQYEYTLFKLVDLKKSNKNKPFLIIDNSNENAGQPINMDRQIVAIPNKNLQKYDSLVSII